MHRNPSKVVCLYCHQPAPYRALFTRGYQLENDFFCSASILTPLMAFKTPTNIQKHLGILKSTTQGPESTIFGHLDQFLARITAVYNPRNGQKNWIFFFSISFQFFPYHWPENLCKWTSASKYLIGVTYSTIFGYWEQFKALKMAISSPINGSKMSSLAKNHFMLIFASTLCPQF